MIRYAACWPVSKGTIGSELLCAKLRTEGSAVGPPLDSRRSWPDTLIIFSATAAPSNALRELAPPQLADVQSCERGHEAAAGALARAF